MLRVRIFMGCIRRSSSKIRVPFFCNLHKIIIKSRYNLSSLHSQKQKLKIIISDMPNKVKIEKYIRKIKMMNNSFKLIY